jgi:hypothetical protein
MTPDGEEQMPGLSDAERSTIIAALTERQAILPCARCGFNQWELVDGYFTHSVQDSIGEIRIGGVNVPTIAAICKRCGFISQHALGALGLLPKHGGNK